MEGFRGCIVFSGECFGIHGCRYGYHCLEVSPFRSLSNSYLLLIALLSSSVGGPERLILALLARQNKQYNSFSL